MKKPPALGTIFATEAEMRKSDAHFDALRQKQQQITDREMAAFSRREVGGEVRYYDGERRYAIYGEQRRGILWFEQRDDGGWYSCRAKKKG